MNPFKAPFNEHSGYSFPLNPYKCAEHEQYYAPVDDTQNSFNNYKNYLNNFSNIPKRHAVLFHGETGCGKTSLMNRCLKLIKQNNWTLGNDDLTLYVVDISNENMVTMSAEKKVNAILDHIHYTLDEVQITEDLYEKFGTQLGKDTNIVLKFLEHQMKKYKKLLIFLFPEITTTEDIKNYMNYFYRSNWILFFESENLEIVQYCKRHHKNTTKYPVKRLGVKPLCESDGERFVKCRLSLLQNNQISFEVNALKKYLKSASTRGGAPIKELEVICSEAYSNALSANKNTICFDDIAHAAISLFQI